MTKQLPQGPNNTPTSLFNPLGEDFTIEWEGKPYTIGSIQVETFPHWLAEHIKKHLAEKWVQTKSDYPHISHEEATKQALKLIEVEL